MKITIIGSGYVGLVSGACFAQMGNDVICVDIDKAKIDALQKGIVPIYEPGLKELIVQNTQENRLHFTTDLATSLQQTNICFIAVGTPMGEDGSADLQYVLQVARSIGEQMRHHLFVVDKSTVPVGTARQVKKSIQQALDNRSSTLTFDVISNPEFLKEGDAVGDFMKPDRVVIGTDNAEALETMRELYAPFMYNHDKIIAMDIESAEMTKYAANAMLATKISFINEMSQICERVGANINDVRKGIGSDSRIGYSFIYPGCGYGGSCFPKDVKALIKTAKDFDYTPNILKAVEEVNHHQKRVIPQKVVETFGNDLSGKKFAVWGLAFKPQTDDMREASALVAIDELTSRGAEVCAYDPKAIPQAKIYLKDNAKVSYATSKYGALKDADALILLTEWKAFRSPDFEFIKEELKSPIIFDGRNLYHAPTIKKKGFEYFQIGVAAK